MEYLEVNKESWNKRVKEHYKSDFYDVKNFIKGKTSLKDIELGLLGDLKGKKVLHLQCHFGQDSISLSRMGAEVTAMDLSNVAIEQARELSKLCNENVEFICCDVYDLANHLSQKYDMIFTSYGVIGWLPDMTKWAKIIAHFLKPGGKLQLIEFHPVLWMFDDSVQKIKYNYFNKEEIKETESGTYANKEANIELKYICWNHSLSEVISSLLQEKLILESIKEYDYSPYNIFENAIELEQGKFRLKHLEDKFPLVYSLTMVKAG